MHSPVDEAVRLFHLRRKHNLRSTEAIYQEISEQVLCQPRALGEICKLAALHLARVRPSKPLVMLFAGPTGVGKTRTALSLANCLDLTLYRFDMGEYAQAHQAANFTGSPRGYRDSELGGLLPNALRACASEGCVLLFDEVEKAHPQIWQNLLALFGEGRCTDYHGTVLAPPRTIIVGTTNLCADRIATNPSEARKHIQAVGHFSAEFLGRIDEVVGFDPLAGVDEEGILKLALQEILKEFGLDLVDSAASEWKTLRERMGALHDGRLVRRSLEQLFNDEILEAAQGLRSKVILREGKFI